MKNQRQRGMTLIELMVALTIGLVITLVVTETYLSGVGTQQAQSGLARAQEASRFAFDLLDRSLKKAGYKNPQGPWNGFCGSGTLLNRLAMQNDVTISSRITDRVTVRYYADYVTPYTNDGTITDCLGNTYAADTLIEDTFYIDTDTANDNEPALFCSSSRDVAGSSSATATGVAALVPGVESMQFLYGEDTNGNGAIDRYTPATSATVPTPNSVRSVMVSLVARTKEAGGVVSTAQTINHFGTVYAPANAAPGGDAGSVFVAPGDRRIRQHTAATIALRNICPL
jgi:type IV pilus assembly protein PilW